MAEPKPIASLSSQLLARKGAARPAMRRQGLGMGGMMSHPMPEGEFIAQDDLGWNDMGYDVDPAHDENVPDYGNLLAGAIPDTLAAGDDTDPTVAQPPVPHVPDVPDVVRQQAEIAERMAEPVADAISDQPSEAQSFETQSAEIQSGESKSGEIQPEPEAPVVEAEEPVQVLSVRKRKVAAPVETSVEALVPAPVPTRVKAPVELPVTAHIAAAPAGRRAAFTLRLDSDRHLKLRLASAVTGQSAQQLVTAALDELLTKIPEIEDLAGRVPRSAGRGN